MPSFWFGARQVDSRRNKNADDTHSCSDNDSIFVDRQDDDLKGTTSSHSDASNYDVDLGPVIAGSRCVTSTGGNQSAEEQAGYYWAVPEEAMQFAEVVGSDRLERQNSVHSSFSINSTGDYSLSEVSYAKRDERMHSTDVPSIKNPFSDDCSLRTDKLGSDRISESTQFSMPSCFGFGPPEKKEQLTRGSPCQRFRKRSKSSKITILALITFTIMAILGLIGLLLSLFGNTSENPMQIPVQLPNATATNTHGGNKTHGTVRHSNATMAPVAKPRHTKAPAVTSRTTKAPQNASTPTSHPITNSTPRTTSKPTAAPTTHPPTASPTESPTDSPSNASKGNTMSPTQQSSVKPTKSNHTKSCVDSTDTFKLNGVEHDCQWLSSQTAFKTLLCNPGNEQYTVCPATCGNCSGEN